MKISFWNIGRGLTKEKHSWVVDFINYTSPDIVAFAEGPQSITDSEKFESDLLALNLTSYYSPHYYLAPKINKQYGWNRCGLKVFHRNGMILQSSFSISNQKLEGRVIYLRCNGYSIFLVHGPSMNGDEIDQASFVSELSRFINVKTIRSDKKDILVVGDFNLEPWDKLLRNRTYLESHFYSKSYSFHASNAIDYKIYWNPIFEYLQNDINSELIGSFFKARQVGLIDFALATKDFPIKKIELLTSINGRKLLNNSNGIFRLPDDLDHLPLVLELN